MYVAGLARDRQGEVSTNSCILLTVDLIESYEPIFETEAGLSIL